MKGAARSVRRILRFSGLFAAVTRAVAANPDASALALIVALGAAMRLAFFFRAPVFVEGDSFQYYRPAHFLIDGDRFPLPLKHPPLFPLFLALIGKWFGVELRNVVAVQAVLGLGTAALTYGVGRLTFGRAAGLTGGLIAAVSGPLLVYEHYIMPETLYMFLMTLALLLFVAGLRSGRWPWFAGSGLAMGLFTLTKRNGQILPLVAIVVLLLYYRRWRPLLRATLPTLASAGLLVVPWMARNQVVHGSFTVVAGLGHSLVFQTAVWRAGDYRFVDPAHPAAHGDHNHRQAAALIDRIARGKAGPGWSGPSIHARLMRTLGLSEAEADAVMRDVALDAIRARPITYLRYLLETTPLVFIGEPRDFRSDWEASRPPAERAQLTKRVRGPTPEQEQGYAFTAWLVNLHQPGRLGPLLPALFLVGLVGSATTPAWRPGLFPGLTVLTIYLVSAAIPGYNPRFHYPLDPSLHVMAFGGVLALRRLPTALVAHPAGRL